MLAGFPNADKVALRIQARRLDDSDPLGWAASLEEADLLVIGAPSGRTTGARALDSIRSKLVPVLSVPGLEIATPKAEQPLVPWRSVLAATDLSPGGNAAVAEAYRILAGTGGRVELCLVEDPDRRPLAPEHWVELQKQLWRLVPPAAERQGIVTRASIVEGRISAERILQAAERLVVDAIVLGVGHRTAVSRALLGSVADEVVLASSRPVILVPLPPAT
jgi:nucleotide-binding universal stress UspA family protein